VRQQHPPTPTPPEQTAGDQELHDSMVVVARFLVIVIIDVRVVIVGFAALPEQVGEQQATAAAAPEQTASDEKLHDAMVVVARFLVLAIIDVRVVIVGFAALPKEVGEQQATAATATEQPAGDQETDDPAIVAARFLIIALINVRIVIVGFAALPKEVGEQQATAAAATEHAAGDQEAYDAMIAAGLTVIALLDVVVGAGLTPLVQEFCEQETSHALAAKQPAGGEEAADIAVPRVSGAIRCAYTHGCFSSAFLA
jgi:hypothetical protein